MATRADFEKTTQARPPLTLPPNLLEREPALAELTPATVAAADAARELERARAAHREAKRQEAFAQEGVVRASAKLAGLLEAGEGAQVPGALYFAHYASSQEVDENAIRMLADRLAPLGLAPRMRETLPSVTAIRDQRRALRQAGLSVDALLTSGPREVRLRRRNIGDGEATA